MKKEAIILHYKKIIVLAESCKEVAKQNYETAARLESEANTALNELGVQQGRAQKGKYKLSTESIIKLMSNLTK